MLDATHVRTLPTISTCRFGQRGDDMIYNFAFCHETGQLSDAVFTRLDDGSVYRHHYGQTERMDWTA